MLKVILGAAAGIAVGWILMALVANTGQPLVISFTLHVPNPKGGTIEVTDKVDCSAVIGKIAILLGICCRGLIGALAAQQALELQPLGSEANRLLTLGGLARGPKLGVRV